MQNETLKVIRDRRSIRNYQTKPVSDHEIQAILEAALYAPTAMNQQELHFSVIKDQQILQKIQAIMKENMLHSGQAMQIERASDPGFVAFHHAPVMIFISADTAIRSAQIDAGIAVENMALAAESLGIGSCIMTSSTLLFVADQNGELGRELGFPEGFSHVCSLSLGYKNEWPEAKPCIEGRVSIL